MHKLLITAAVLLAPATPALAQDYYPAPVSVSGIRAEARIGYDRIIAEINTDSATDSSSVREGKSGVTYGGEIGYDAQVNASTVLGVYAGIEQSSAEFCGRDAFGAESCVKSGRNITVGARGGYLFAPDGLVYIKGGFSSGQIRVTYDDPTFPQDNYDLRDNLSGFHLGAGVQKGFGRNFYGKVEYLYTDYNGYESTDSAGTKTSLDFSRHQVTAGLGVRF